MAMITVIGLTYDPATRDWTLPVEYKARDRMEAIRWMNFNRDWMKNLHIEEYPGDVQPGRNSDREIYGELSHDALHRD